MYSLRVGYLGLWAQTATALRITNTQIDTNASLYISPHFFSEIAGILSITVRGSDGIRAPQI